MKKLIFIILLCLITTSALAQYMPQQKPMLGQQINWADPITKGLVCALFFNEGSGDTVFDLSGNGNNGTFSADAHFVAGKFGSAVNFDGSGDLISVVDSPSLALPSQFSMSCWVRQTSSGRDSLINKNANDYEVALDPASSRIIVWFGDGVNDTTLLFTGGGGYSITSAWRHVVVSCDKTGGSCEVWLDGVSMGIETGTARTGSGSQVLTIGARDAGNQLLAGDIDHILLWNRILIASEADLLYREPFCMFEQDDIAMMAKAAEAPAPGGGQVITIITSMVPILIIPAFIFVRRKRIGRVKNRMNR